MPLISSRSNSKIKAVRALRRRKERQKSGQFLAEGIHHVGEAVEAASARPAGPQVEAIFYAPDLLTSDFARALIHRQEARGLPCYATTADVFASIADKENPQGILAVVAQPQTRLEAFAPDNLSWGVVLVSPQDPGNLGTILRTMDAVGADGLILLDEGVDPFHPGSVRASMGAIFWIPILQSSFDRFSAWANQHGYHVFGTSARGRLPYREIAAYPRPRLLLMGSEREGLTPEQASVCEEMLRLPMSGRVSSLNLGVATGVFLYAMLEED